MVVFAFAPLFWASLADWKGRRPLYLLSLLIYIAANVLLAALPAHFAALVVLRVVQAFGSAAVVSMGAGTVADTTEPKKRARAMSYFLLGPQCGPILGPVVGGALAGGPSWRWIFGFLAMLAAALWLAILLLLPETLRARVGNGRVVADRWLVWPLRASSPRAPEPERGPPPPKPSLAGYWRLFAYPPIGIVCLNTAVLYASYFCIAVQLPAALQGVYRWSTASVGAGYLVVGIAMVLGSLSGGHFSDWRRARIARLRGEHTVTPEIRLLDQIWGVLLCAAGLLMFGWFVDRAVHPAATLVSTFLSELVPRPRYCEELDTLTSPITTAGFGMSWIFVASNAFLTECIAQQAAAAFALGNMLRNPAAAVAAAIIEPLVRRMGWGWCFTGLSLLNLVGVGASVTVLRLKSSGWREQRQARMAAAAKSKS
ncbi:Dityrosine transporter 1 [Ophidiomyces ophidiicola]|nr:Dityrosine transporter 1 [Ophidiomyces ophidiicola]